MGKLSGNFSDLFSVMLFHIEIKARLAVNEHLGAGEISIFVRVSSALELKSYEPISVVL